MNDSNSSCLDMTNNLTSISDEMKGKQTFTQKIRLPESLDLKNSIFQFIRKMQISHLEERDIVMKTQQKILQIEKQFQLIHNETDSQIIEENYEVIERIIIKALYSQLIKGCRIKYDRKIEFYCRLYDFLQPNHFQVDSAIINHQNYLKAKQQIQNIDSCQTPKDKITCIVNACKLISNALAMNSKNTPTGIDDLLPVMLYLVIQSLPARPLTNLQFIQELRNEKYLLNEEYYFTLYSSVMELIENLQWSDLKDITEKQFNESCKQNHKKYSQFLDAVDKEEEEIKKQEIFKIVIKLQNNMKEYQERFKIFDNNNKLKFADKPYQSMCLGDLQEFYNEYHILHKHIVDSQIELEKEIKFVDNFIHTKTGHPQQSHNNQQIDSQQSNQNQNKTKQSSFFSFF